MKLKQVVIALQINSLTHSRSTRAMIIINLILLIVIFDTHGQMFCNWGKYGENCSKNCPETCFADLNRNLIHCQKETGKCSEGCVPGWFDDLCDKDCSKNCLKNICNRQNGICTFRCVGNYTGDFCNTLPGTSAPPPREVTTHPSTTDAPESTPTETSNLAAILVPLFVFLTVILAVFVLLLCVWLKWKRGEQIHIVIPAAVMSSIPCLKTTDTAARCTAGEDMPLTSQRNEAGIGISEKDDDSTCSFELLEDDGLPPGTLDQKIKDVQKVFVETGSFKKAKEELDTFGHVTITGCPGEGKTSMALMLGAEYRKQGYEVELVEDLDKARLRDYLHIGKDVCVIFDDIFKTVRSHKDLSGIKHFLYDLHVYLGQSESRSERRYQSLQLGPRGEPRKLYQPHICVIFTAEASNLKYALSKLGGHRIFIRSSYVQLCYTKEEKRELWRIYKCPHEGNLDENIITSYKNTTVGFPLACKLISSCVDFKHESDINEPLFYIKKQLQTIFGTSDDKSAALTLMVLCGGQLNIGQLKPARMSPHSQQKTEAVRSDSPEALEGITSNGQLHTDGDNPDLEVHLQAVTALVKTSTRQGVAKALRGFCGTFLTEGNMMTFSHSLIYDVCASVLFSIEPQFTLRHLSVKFLLEHIEDQHPDIGPVSMLTIPFSEANRGILVDRLADLFARGALTEYILHPIWRHELIANKFTTVTHHPDHLPEDVRHHILCYACVTGNTTILGQLVRHCDINRRGLNSWTPVMYAVVSEQMDCFDVLVKRGADISLYDVNNYNILHLACLHGHVPTVKHVKKFLKKHHIDSYTNQFLNIQANTGWTPVMCAVVFGIEGVSDCFIKPKKKTDIVKTKKIDFGLRDHNNNTLLHLACQYGSKTTVENLLPDTDVDTRGSNGQTPVMCAVLSGRKKVFDTLVSKKADLTLTDEDNNSLLHAACTVHDVTMLMCMKTKLDINIRGQHGWTPAMKTAANGNKEGFEHLLDPRKDHLQKDDRGNNLLHLACHGGNVAIVKQLLQIFDINIRGNNGWTPVMFAAVNGLQSVFDLLVSTGADIRLRDNSNNSVLHLACIGGDVSIVNSLLPKTDVNCLGHKGRTAIMVTALHARPTLFELLLSKKANIRLADDNKDTILHLAFEGGNCSIVKYLIRKFDINASGRHGRTPVMAAALAGMRGVFDLLVSQNAHLTLTDDLRDSVLHLACQGGNTAIVEHLVTYFEANLQGQKGAVDEHTPRERQGDTVTIVNEVTGGFDIDIRGNNDQTPLMRAVCGGHLEVYRFLKSHQADHTLVDTDGQTLLHLASRHGQLHVIEYIIGSVDINSRDKAGLTPVMTSVTCDKVAVFKYLRGKGADLSLVDNARNDVLQLAHKRENRQMVELLEQLQKVKRQSGRNPSHPKKKRQSN